jgi:solute carrier family 25 protein 44
VFPASLVKTRLQLETTPTRTSALQTFLKVLRVEGVRSLYQGFPLSAAGAVPAQMVYLSTYESTKQYAKNILNGEVTANLVAGMCASVASQIIVVPVDIISQKQMIHVGKATGASNIAWEIMGTKGVRGLYRGFGASIATYAPQSGIWWASYAGIKKGIREFWDPSSYEANLLLSAGSGTLAGFTSAIATCPLDVIKTRLQTVSLDKSFGQVVVGLAKEQGISGLGFDL